MIEKIMRAVKSNNKKKGRNITIGAVVGMLLSCTAVMGKDVVGLEIGKSGSEIIFKDKDGNKSEDNPYPENSWDGNTYINNITLSGTSNDDSSIGRGISLKGGLGEFKFINNALITGTATRGSSFGAGIYNGDNTITELVNDGSIKGTSTKSGSYGIQNNSGTITELINKGSIIGTSTKGGSYGIYNYYCDITELINKGSIIGTSTKGESYGIYSEIIIIETLTNNGTIIGTSTKGESYGIYNVSITMITLTNTGVVYGKTNAIYNLEMGKLINSANNYGLLVSGDSDENVTTRVTIVAHDAGGGDNEIKNYGLAFTADSSSTTSKYIGGGKGSSGETNPNIDYHNNFGKTHQNVSIDGVDYDIINVDAEVDTTSKVITDWKSLSMKDGKLYSDADDITNSEISDFSSDKQYILNGIEDTLKVSGENNKLNNSVVNAYKAAVVIIENMSILTLDNIVVNGGIAEDSSTISITKDGSTLTLKGDSVINTGDKSTAITVDGDKNTITLEGNTIVNGDMKADGEKNTLNLYGKQNITRSSDIESMNILYDIDGFGRIQIENNVTFFEDVKITGVDRLNINNGGTLSLRLKKDRAKATHALNDHADGANNPKLLIAGKENGGSENAGTLNFLANGIGTGAVVDMGGIDLENVYLRVNTIFYNLEVVNEVASDANIGDIRLDVGTSLLEIYNERKITRDPYVDGLPDEVLYNSLNKIYKSSVAVDDNVDAITDMIGSASDEEQWEKLLTFLGGIYTESPYSYSSELSRRSVGMFRDIVTENEFRPNLNNWLIMGGLTHADGGTKDTYYGKNYYEFDTGSSTTNADMKLTGAYMLAKYGYSENLSLGLTLGGNKSEAKLDMAKVKGNSGYLGAFAENYRGNLTLKAGVGIQYSEYDTDRSTLGGHNYSDKYSDMTYDIYLNGRYSHNIGDNLFLEPYATLSYTYVDQDGANEGNKALAIDTDSQSFDYTVGKVGVDLKKVIPHEKGKSTLTAGVSYTKILDGAEGEYITGRFKGGSDFDILVAHKNEHSIGLNAKYALELENGVLFDIKGTYSVERDSHNGSGKNRTKGEWIAGAGMGYKF